MGRKVISSAAAKRQLERVKCGDLHLLDSGLAVTGLMVAQGHHQPRGWKPLHNMDCWVHPDVLRELTGG